MEERQRGQYGYGKENKRRVLGVKVKEIRGEERIWRTLFKT